MEKYYGWGLPFDASVHGYEVDRLIYIIHIVMALLFVGWLTYFITALIKFRSRAGHQAQHHPKHSPVTKYVEIGVVIIEVALLLGFSFPIFSAYRDKLPAKEDALRIRVVAEQFAWNIHYPGTDNVFGKTKPQLMGPGNPIGLDPEDLAGKDDVVAINQLHIPVGKPVIAQLSSKDVIHGFYLPVMRVKQDAIPGHEVTVWFEAKKTGKFEIACAQLCGLGHYRMRGFFFIDTPEQFATWMQSFDKLRMVSK